MKFCISGIIFSLLLSVVAKPGESYVLTGREKSVFSIFQTDLKAYPDLYAGEDVNAYFQAFKTLNNLGERKLQLGEELRFPDTAESKKVREAEAQKAAQAAKEAEAAAARARAKEAAEIAREQGIEPVAESPKEEPYGKSMLFGSDRPSSARVLSPAEKQARAEAQRKSARHQAIHYFQHTLLPHLMFDYNRTIAEDVEKGTISTLVEEAQADVDELFAKALVLHAYPEKGIYILEFEKPEKAGEYFFFAIKREDNELPRFYSLERGISFFGTGNEGVLYEWLSSREFSDLGGRDYKDLSRFLQELEVGPTAPSENE